MLLKEMQNTEKYLSHKIREWGEKQNCIWESQGDNGMQKQKHIQGPHDFDNFQIFPFLSEHHSS